jgi:pimeloyl-ACP methyl ester carboxylesterase
MGEAEPSWSDGWWQSADGVRLHYRDYPGDPAAVPVLCVPGLTRNARDSAALATRTAGERRVIVVELRGRGESGCPKDPLTYVPPVYLQDLGALLAELGLGRIVMIGTSLGGLLAMLLAVTARPLLAGVVLNDIGPVIEAQGLARIRSYVGKGASWPTWLHAARVAAEVHRIAYPDYGVADWIAMAHRLCRLTPEGRVVQDYDARIAEPFKLPPPDPPIDLWPAFDALAGGPVLLVRGGLSDVLSAATAAEMARRVPGLELLTLPRIGHAPTLDEPEAVDAIDRLLAQVA